MIDSDARITTTSKVSLGRFGHHPDPANDFCIEVEAIEGMAYDVSVGLDGSDDYELYCRIHEAMSFRVGGDEIAVRAKQRLRDIWKVRLAAKVEPFERSHPASVTLAARVNFADERHADGNYLRLVVSHGASHRPFLLSRGEAKKLRDELSRALDEMGVKPETAHA